MPDDKVDDDADTDRYPMPAMPTVEEWICDECGEQVTGERAVCPSCGAEPKEES